MAMRCEEVTELLDAYALGALDSDEAWDVDLHLGVLFGRLIVADESDNLAAQSGKAGERTVVWSA